MPVYCLDDIGFRQLANHQQNRRLGVGHPGVTHILYRVSYRGDIAQTHGGAVVVVDNSTAGIPSPFSVHHLSEPASDESCRRSRPAAYARWHC
ncbi:Uncharacterised protein [Citrobacter koseri]|uniref:Uncharacterized protein n=1 Tax=Citrobacter koseri TaxID=545 RepID=A0A447UHP5_CITKO|nr:Uncharacterised protein [Citrobacter koseri]